MCDETTVRERPATASAGGPVAPFEKPQPGLVEAMVEVTTQDGVCEAFLVHPAEGKHPGVVLWPDAFGVRAPIQAMARRLAAEGYAVLAVNQFYRESRLPLDISFASLGSEEGRARLMTLLGSLKPDQVARDAAAFVAFLDAQPVVDNQRGIGTQGYCMGGACALRTAGAVPDRVKAVASFHGGNLVTGAPESAHRTIAKTRASYLILPGSDDNQKEPHARDALREAADAAGRPAEIEVYNANHGWCVPDAPAYDVAEAERAWGRLLALYAGL